MLKSENLAGTATLSALALPTDTSSTQPKSLRRVRLQPPTLRTGVRGRQFNRQRGKCSWKHSSSPFLLWAPPLKLYRLPLLADRAQTDTAALPLSLACDPKSSGVGLVC